jgi:copper(I)-binding protein
MRPVDALTIPAGETVALDPGGFHVMLIDPVAPLAEGGQVRLVLTFEAAGEIEVLADVVATGGPR